MGSFGGPDMPRIRALRQYRKLAWKKGGGGRREEGKTGKEGLQDFRETEISQKGKFTKE